MTRVETIGAATLYLADCRDVLPRIRGAKVLCSDPPYRLTAGGKYTGEMGGVFAVEVYDNDGGIVDCDIEFSDWMPLAFAALADDADAYVMANDKNQNAAQNAMLNAGFKFHNLLVWDKGTATPNRWYMKNLEFTIYSWKGRARGITDKGAKQLIRCPQVDVTLHPTEKPVALMKHYITNSTDAGATVLDPFMGTGTTGVAALESGRAFIGIESSEKWFDVACERLSRWGERPDLFRADNVKSDDMGQA
ncbi:MAG: DNA methyltransferase [Parvibaculum sp.]|nr:DNA methyltransferase [Parvibaculum sp.]